jgi:glucose uptake protein GlcU
MLCWGSWGNTQKLASREWKYQLFYWDYGVGILLSVLAMAFTMGVLGGVVWNIGMAFSLIASSAAGAALSYALGQGATMVSALWGIFIWKEFKDAPPGTNKLLAAMFACFVVGLGILVASKL